jgi:diguanylate cyclase (GGDEF)-like protein
MTTVVDPSPPPSTTDASRGASAAERRAVGASGAVDRGVEPASATPREVGDPEPNDERPGWHGPARWTALRNTTLPAALPLSLAPALTLLLALAERNLAVDGTLWALHLVPVAIAFLAGGLRWGVVVGLLGVLTSVASPAPATSTSVLLFPLDEVALRSVTLAAFLLVLGVARGVRASHPSAVRIDFTTGLAPSDAFAQLVDLEIQRARRYSRDFTLALVRLEDPAGEPSRRREWLEEILERTGFRLRGSLRRIDVLARRGEREFLLLLPESGPDAARIVLDRIVRLLSTSLPEESPTLSFSIGALTWVDADLNVSQLFQRTDQLRYEARSGGQLLQHSILDSIRIPSERAHLRLER